MLNDTRSADRTSDQPLHVLKDLLMRGGYRTAALRARKGRAFGQEVGLIRRIEEAMIGADTYPLPASERATGRATEPRKT